MKRDRSIISLIAVCALLLSACTSAKPAMAFSPGVALVGSTPCGEHLRQTFLIDADTPIDFIRWRLNLTTAKGVDLFALDITYGEAQPNTNGFKSGGETRSFAGKYSVNPRKNGDIYRFIIDNGKRSFSIVKLGENTFHILTAADTLMVGTGGWNYTLNRKARLAGGDVISSQNSIFQTDAASEVVFAGRTPCAEIAGEYKWPLERECPKLKWKLTLSRDLKTGQPTEYAIQRTLERPNVLKGKWTLVQNKDALIVLLDPDIPEKKMSLLVGDENVLFFLDKSGRLYTGNDDFSYTLNRSVK